MNKAIPILQELLNYEEEAKAKTEIQEALAELKAYKAALQKLKKVTGKPEIADLMPKMAKGAAAIKEFLQKIN